MDRRRSRGIITFLFFSLFSLFSFIFQICHKHGLELDTKLSFHLFFILLAPVKVGRLLLLLEDLIQIRFDVLYSYFLFLCSFLLYMEGVLNFIQSIKYQLCQTVPNELES